MRILKIAVTVLGLVGEPRVLVRVEFLNDASAASGFMACSCHPRKSEEAAKAVSLQNRCH